MRIDVKAFALACAVLSAIGLMLGTWWIIAFDGPSTNPTWLGHIYRGYTLTWAGSLVGAAWGFVDGLMGGALFAWLYDFFEGRVTHDARHVAARVHPA